MQVEEAWKEVKTIINDPCDKFLKKKKIFKISKLMYLKRHNKYRDSNKYNEIQRLIRKEIREVKEGLMKEEIELLESKHDRFNMHK